MSLVIEESTNKMNGDTSVENTDDDDEPIPRPPIDPDDNGGSDDSGLIGWKIALIIASLVLVKEKNNYAN